MLLAQQVAKLQFLQQFSVLEVVSDFSIRLGNGERIEGAGCRVSGRIALYEPTAVAHNPQP